MKKILWLLIFFVGCSTTSVRVLPPPNRSLLKNKNLNMPDLTESERLSLQFNEANDLPLEEACKTFSELSQKNISPISDAAMISRLERCELSKREFKNIATHFNPQSFAKEIYLNKSLELAKKFELESLEAEFAFQLSTYKKTNSLKIELLNRAIELAKKNDDTENLKRYFEKLKEVSPRFETNITPENKYKIAKDFEAIRNFKRARELYQEIIDANDTNVENLVKALNANRMSYKVERDLKTFLVKTKEMQDFLLKKLTENQAKNIFDNKLKEAYGDAIINYARAVWTEHQPTEAVNELDAFLTNKIDIELDLPNQKANAELIKGLILLEDKKNKEALSCIKAASLYKVTDKNLQENIQWALVWNSYLIHDYKNAIIYADKFAKPSLNPVFFNKLYYWKGKSLLKLKQPSEAQKVFETLFQNDLYGYYGIISAIELKKPLPPIPVNDLQNAESGNAILDWLLALNQTQLAQNYLKEIDRSFKTIKERELAMNLYWQTNWYQGGMRQLTNFPLKYRNEITEKYSNVLFPNPHFQTNVMAAKKFQIPVELILAITRQESAFVATERSWADAFGLMQMIPEKASELSKKYSIEYKNFNDLYRPEINIQMGAALLAENYKKYNGKFAQTVAAYNASPKAISTWEKERFNGNYFEFIEMIPYEETRNYIKLVFRNYITYKRINAKESFELNPNFFAEPFSH